MAASNQTYQSPNTSRHAATTRSSLQSEANIVMTRWRWSRASTTSSRQTIQSNLSPSFTATVNKISPHHPIDLALINLYTCFTGESSLSNESDSNCSSSSLINLNLENQQQQQQEQIFINTLSQSTSGVGDFSKQLIIATKVEPFQLKNLTNCAHKLNDELTFSNSNNVNTPAQFNLIKMNNPKENLTANSFYNNSMQTTGTLKLPITTKINSLVDHNPNGNHKTIIQYKQLLTTNLNNSLKQPTIIASNSQQQQQQQQNNNSLISLNAVSMTSNVNDSNTTGNCDFLQLISTSAATNNNNNSTTNSKVINTVDQVLIKIKLNKWFANEKIYPKPPYSYSCLIAMALRNSDSGTLPVSDIYEFIM